MRKITSRIRSAARSAINELRGRPFATAADRMQSTIISSDSDKRITQAVRGQTMTNPLRVHALLDAATLVAKSLRPLELPPLELGEIGKIVSLVLESSSAVFQTAANPSQLPTHDRGRHRGWHEKSPMSR